MASEPLTVVLLLGLGYDRLSVAPPALPLVRWVLRTIPDDACRGAAQAALQASSAEEVLVALRHALHPHLDLRLLDS
jgi:signal transduction protein with GAF and PtsI domain